MNRRLQISLGLMFLGATTLFSATEYEEQPTLKEFCAEQKLPLLASYTYYIEYFKKQIQEKPKDRSERIAQALGLALICGTRQSHIEEGQIIAIVDYLRLGYTNELFTLEDLQELQSPEEEKSPLYSAIAALISGAWPSKKISLEREMRRTIGHTVRSAASSYSAVQSVLYEKKPCSRIRRTQSHDGGLGIFMQVGSSPYEQDTCGSMFPFDA